MTEIDKRQILENEVFTYHVSKDDKVFIYWCGKQVTVLKGKEAQTFVSRIEHLIGQEAQFVMAKATGNFKRGNER